MRLSWWSLIFALMWANNFVFGGVIMIAPSNQTVGINTTATLECTVDLSPGEEVRWLRNDLLLFRGRDFIDGTIGAGDADRFEVMGTGNDPEYNLKITGIARSDADDIKYTCQIFRLGNVVSSRSAYLIVHSAPSNFKCTFQINYSEEVKRSSAEIPVTTRVGDLLTFQCEVNDGIPKATLDLLELTDGNERLLDPSPDKSSGFLYRYFERNLTAEDNGRSFKCESNYTSSIIPYQKESCTYLLDVTYPISNISLLNSNGDPEGNVKYGTNLMLTCNADGGNPISKVYNWTTSPTISPERYLSNGSVFQLIPVEEEDQGLVIQCEATNNIGQGLRTNLTLNVIDLPTTPIPTLKRNTSPEAISVSKAPVQSVPFSTTYIIIVILVALVILLATVCCVLFLINRRPPKDAVPLAHMQMSVSDNGRMSYSRQMSTDTMLDEDDDSLKKGKCSHSCASSMKRQMEDFEEEPKLQNLQTGRQLKSHNNLYGETLGAGQPDIRRSPLAGRRQCEYSPEPEDLKKPSRRRRSRDSPDSGCSYSSGNNSRQCRTATPGGDKRGRRKHKNLKPTNSTGPDWPNEQKREKYSPLARRYYSPSQEELNSPSIPSTYNTIGASPRPRRCTQSELDLHVDAKPRKGHRRHRSHGSDPNLIESQPITARLSPPVEYPHYNTPSPVMQRKNKREQNDASLQHHQRHDMHQRRTPSPRHTSPRSSPRTSPHSSPQHRPNKNRPLPDPGLDGNDSVLIDIEAGSDSNQHTYTNRTPVMYRKQYADEQSPQQQCTSQQNSYDEDEDEDDEEYTDYDENYDEFPDDDDSYSDV